MTSFSDLIGIRWVEGGRDASGMDCYGVVLEVLERLGLPMFDVWEQWREAYWDGWRAYRHAVPDGWEWLEPEASADLREGDVLVTRDAGVPRHLAVVVEARSGLGALTAFDPHGVVLTSISHATEHLEGVVRRVAA